MPKADYPSLSVSPINLVTSCKNCNEDKKNHKFSNYESNPIHPYFEDFNDQRWISARISITSDSEMSFEYYVLDNVPTWDTSKINRAKNNFIAYAHAISFSDESIREAIVIMDELQQGELNSMSDQDIRNYFLEEAKKSQRTIVKGSIILNNWKIAMYYALADYQDSFDIFKTA